MGIPVMEKFLVGKGTISLARWQTWRNEYIQGRRGMRGNFIDASRLQNTPPAAFIRPAVIYGARPPISTYTTPTALTAAFPPKDQAPVSVVLLGGGYGGRLFGYDVPEEDRIKILAPVIEFRGRTGVTPLEIRLRYFLKLREAGYSIFPSIMANDVNGDKIRGAVEEGLGTWDPRVDIFAQVGLPRLVPHPLDLSLEAKFMKHLKDEQGISDPPVVLAEAQGVSRALGDPGDILLAPQGTISRKPPGHLDGLTLYVLKHMKRDLQRGVKVTLINGGEEIGFLYNPPLINWVLNQSEPKPLTFIFHELSIGTKGGGVFSYDGRNQIFDGCQIAQSQGFPPGVQNITKSLLELVVHIPALLGAMGLTETGFLSMSEDEIQAALDRKIYGGLNPILEIKPVGVESKGTWGAQMAYLLGQATSIFETNLVMGTEDTFPFPELKAPPDVPKANDFVRGFYERFL